jgi:hypothetical protein
MYIDSDCRIARAVSIHCRRFEGQRSTEQNGSVIDRFIGVGRSAWLLPDCYASRSAI